MLPSDNPKIDAAALAERVDQELARRCAAPLIDAPLTPARPPASRGWRQRLREVPGLGRGLVWGMARWRRVRAPGLSLAQRVRAVPVIGDVAAWFQALMTLASWRARLREELIQTQAQLQDLRAQQLSMQKELRSLRQALQRPQSPPLGDDRKPR